MSKTDRTQPEQGITPRHARGCRHREGGCTCSPTFKAQGYDSKAQKRITRSFTTITAARRWRQDAYAALRAGTLTADTGPTLQEAAHDWLEAARAGIIRSRSGTPTSRPRCADMSSTYVCGCSPRSVASGLARSRCRCSSDTSTGSPARASPRGRSR